MLIELAAIAKVLSFSFKCRSFRAAYDKLRYRDIVSLIIARAHFILPIIRPTGLS